MFTTSFLFGFAFAFYYGWLLTLILCGGIPFLLLAGAGMAISLEAGFTNQMKAYSQSAGYADQALNAIKVVHTYGQEALEEANYEKYLKRAMDVGKKQSFVNGFGQGGVFALFFALYAYSYYFGGLLKWNDVKNGDTYYTGGQIITIMFAVTLGALNLGSSGPFIKAIQEGRVAGAMAFKVIDNIPKVNSREEGKKKVEKETLIGEIKFNNINFTYPLRPDL
jgi:ABC-type multidrug transport system fused ATPase/permease subunit